MPNDGDKFGPPYRAPCGGWPTINRWFPGPLYNQSRTTEQHVQYWKNKTVVANRDSTNPTPEPPYPRYGSGGSFGVSPGCPADQTCPAPDGQTKCGPWHLESRCPGGYDDRLACPSPGGANATVDRNCYHADAGQFLDLSGCIKFGFKNVQARKRWHGRFGFLSHDASKVLGCRHQLGAECGSCLFEPYQASPDQTKYLRVARSITYLVSNPTLSDYWDLSSETEVDRNSGVISLRACNKSTNTDGWSGFHGESAISNFQRWSGGCVSQDDIDGNNFDHSHGDGFGGMIWDTHELSVSNTTLHEHVYLAQTAYDGLGHPTGIDVSFDWTLDIVLSSEYTAADIYAEIKSLLAYWNLADDARYPWRHDGFVSVAPLVTRNEPPSAIDPDNPGIAVGYLHGCDISDCSDAGASVPWIDTNSLTYDGAIRGIPLPAGYGPHFDWEHRTFNGCDNPDAPFVHYIGAWGGSRGGPAGGIEDDHTDVFMPDTATQWTTNYINFDREAGYDHGYHGAWVEHSSGVMRAQKWAEVKLWRPSYNFFRPCGADRYSAIPSTVRCIDDISGDVVTLNEVESAPAINTGDTCLTQGDAWVVTKLGDYSFRLTTHVASIPTDCNAPGCGVGAHQFGKARFPGAWAICGRAAVAAVEQSGGNVGVTLKAPGAPYLRVGDVVDFAGVPGLGSAVTVSGFADTLHFSVGGTIGAGYAGGGHVSSHGAPAYQLDDDNSKGDYVLLDWQFNLRDIAEADRVCAQFANDCHGCTAAEPPGFVTCDGATSILRASQAQPREVTSFSCSQKCVGRTPCCPSVMCISPNGETFPCGNVHPFPVSFAADERYGARWQSEIVQSIVDPLWEAPHKYCDGDGAGGFQPGPCAWVEDDGQCVDDDVDCPGGGCCKRYPHRPMVEARCSPPAGSPALPPGVTMDFSDYPPPAGIGPHQTSQDTDWSLFAREVACVCGNPAGRFAFDYRQDGVDVC